MLESEAISFRFYEMPTLGVLTYESRPARPMTSSSLRCERSEQQRRWPPNNKQDGEPFTRRTVTVTMSFNKDHPITSWDEYNEAVGKQKELLAYLKSQQAGRGEQKMVERLATRQATHNTWRQMSGVKLALHEMNHPGNKPFVIGFASIFLLGTWAYRKGLNSEEAQKDSKYWQRFHATH